MKPGYSEKKFYSAAFGWTFTDYGPDYVAFENSGTSGGFGALATSA
jgi:predicted enzyme related to lactoylglutathione lyase